MRIAGRELPAARPSCRSVSLPSCRCTRDGSSASNGHRGPPRMCDSVSSQSFAANLPRSTAPSRQPSLASPSRRPQRARGGRDVCGEPAHLHRVAGVARHHAHESGSVDEQLQPPHPRRSHRRRTAPHPPREGSACRGHARTRRGCDAAWPRGTTGWRRRASSQHGPTPARRRSTPPHPRWTPGHHTATPPCSARWPTWSSGAVPGPVLPRTLSLRSNSQRALRGTIRHAHPPKRTFYAPS